MLMQYAPLVGALLAGVCQAAPAVPAIISAPVSAPINAEIVDVDIAPRSKAPLAFHVNKHLVDETLYAGLTSAGANLDINVPRLDIVGDIAIEASASFLLDATVKIDLGGLKAVVDLDVNTEAKIFTAIELVAAEDLKLAIPGLLSAEILAGAALDLILAVDAKAHIAAGVAIEFPAGAFIEVNLLTKEVGRHQLGGLVAKPLPFLGIDVDAEVEITVDLGLRLRAGLAVNADVDLPILDIGLGAEVSIFVALFDYTSVIIGTPECALSVVESLSLHVGIAVDVDVEVAGLIDLTLAPTVSATLVVGPQVTLCLPSIGAPPAPVPTFPGGNGNNGGSAITGGASSGSAVATGVDSGSATATGTGNGSASASSSFTGVSNSTASATSSGDAQITPAPTTGNGDGDLITSTIHTTKTYTITSCVASVPNCPAEHTQKVVTSVIISKTTVCPATQTSASDNVPDVTTAVTTLTLTTCPVPTTGVFTPPTDKPTQPATVTITEEAPKPTGTPVSPPAESYPAKPVSPPAETQASKPVSPPAETYPAKPVSPPAESYPAKPVSPPAETQASKPVSPPAETPVSPPAGGYPVQPTGGYPAQPPAPSGTGAYETSPCPGCAPVTAGASRALSHALAGVVAAGAAFALL